MGTLLLHFQQLRNGLPSLNMAVPTLKMIHVKDVQKVQQHQKSVNRCTTRYGIGWPTDKNAWNCWDYRHFKRMCRIYFVWRIGYEKVLRKMGAALLIAEQKRTRMKISEQCLECFNKNKTDFFASIYYYGWDLNSPLHTRNQTAVKTVDRSRFSAPKKTSSVPSAGKVMALVFWDAWRHFIYWLSWKG